MPTFSGLRQHLVFLREEPNFGEMFGEYLGYKAESSGFKNANFLPSYWFSSWCYFDPRSKHANAVLHHLLHPNAHDDG
jgi:hypothetical protein